MSKKIQNQEAVKQRNWIAVAAHFKTGAGRHQTKKTYSRKVKHKGRPSE